MKSLVYKYPITPPREGFEIIIEIPWGSKLLSVETVGETPVIYVQVPSETTPIARLKFLVVPTGVEVEDPGAYIGSFQVAP